MNEATTSPLAYYSSRLHNPFLKSIPSWPDDAELKKSLGSVHPAPDVEVRGAPKADRLKYLSHLRLLHIPLGRDLELAHMVRDILQDRYTACMPNAEYVASQRDRVDAFLRRAFSSNTEDDYEATGHSLIGPSAAGKSRTIKRVLRIIPQTIAMDVKADASLPTQIVVWVRVEFPSNKRVSALIDAIFTSLELATKQAIPPEIRGKNISENVEAIALVCDEVRLGLLVLDEAQHALRKGNEPDRELMNFLVSLGNTLGVPILMIGTPLAQKIVGREMRQARRMVGLQWPVMEADSKAWRDFTTGLHKFQFTKKLIPLDKLDPLLFQYSQGLPGIAVLLYRYAQRYAILAKEEDEVIDESIMKAVSEDFFKVVQPMLDALKSGDSDRLALFEDLSFDDFELGDDLVGNLVETRRKIRENLIKGAFRSGKSAAKMIKNQVLRDATALVGPGGLDPKLLRAMRDAKERGEDVALAVINAAKQSNSSA